MIVNRGAVPVNAAVETILPLDLGALAEVSVARSDGGQPEPPVRMTLSPAEAEQGMLLANRARCLALRWRATGEVIERVTIEPDAGLGRLTLRIHTRPDMLTPGAGRRFCQYFEVLA
jgi:hypothetical protein